MRDERRAVGRGSYGRPPHPSGAHLGGAATIILTGATGFLGGFLLEGLLERGYQVTVLGRASKELSLAERLAALVRWFGLAEPGERLSALEADLSRPHLGLDEATYGRLCARGGKIIHCASDTSFAERNRARVMEANVAGLSALLELAADARAEHLTYVSTAFAAGVREGLCLEAPPAADRFTNVYEESKAQAEGIVTRACGERGVPLSILRPSIVFGHSRTGAALKFNALYYPVKSLLTIRDLYAKDLLEQGGERSRKWGISLGEDGLLRLPLAIDLPRRGSVNLIPVDYFVEAALRILEHPGAGGVYHLTSAHPQDLTTLLEYCERFLGLRGVHARWGAAGTDRTGTDPAGTDPAGTDPAGTGAAGTGAAGTGAAGTGAAGTGPAGTGAAGTGPARSPAEELFDRLIEPYRPYLADGRLFDRSRTSSLCPELAAPPLTYEMFERCMAYAVACDWGKGQGERQLRVATQRSEARPPSYAGSRL